MHAGNALHRGAARGRKQGMRGVTLIELMVVLVIVGILVGIAYPGYQAQMQSTRRATGKAKLLETAQALERCFTRFHAYDDDGCEILDPLGDGIASDGDWYIVTDSAPATGSFALVATPQGAQADDTQCANLTLNSANDRGASGPRGDDCW
jgi:type IV pilus assembly protein PilE